MWKRNQLESLDAHLPCFDKESKFQDTTTQKPLLQHVQNIHEAITKTSLSLTSVFQGRLGSNFRRKKLHRRSKSFNFVRLNFSKGDPVCTSIHFRSERQFKHRAGFEIRFQLCWISDQLQILMLLQPPSRPNLLITHFLNYYDKIFAL